MATAPAPSSTGDSRYQPGGTALFVKGDWTGRILKTSEDTGDMGRWCTITIQGKGDIKLDIICGYRSVDQDIASAGTTTNYYQQWMNLRAKGDQQPDPREQFFIDLGIHIEKLKTEKHEIMLMMDANESTTERNSRVEKFFIKHGLVDLHAMKHKDLDDPPNTYIRGSKCIDFFAGTEGVTGAVDRAGIEAFCQTFYSDHRGLFMDINMTMMLKGTPADLGAL